MNADVSLEPAEILELFGKRALVIKPGLERTQKAWEKLGFPGRDIPKVLVAGTNGKGSTSGLLWHLLAACGRRVGLFSSPHLIAFRERITISDRDVSNEVLVSSIHSIKSRLGSDLWEELTFFEINTLLALEVFNAAQVDWMVLEVGLGGRLDSTNIVDPEVSLITSIGLDHMAYLGPNTRTIAREKAGIMRPSRPCLWGGVGSSDDSAHEEVLRMAAETKSFLRTSGLDFADAKSPELFWGSHKWPWPVLSRAWPDYLRQNLGMAVAALCNALAIEDEKNSLDVDENAISHRITEALKRLGSPGLPWPVTLKGRFQRVRVSKQNRSYDLILDVCHNPHGAKAFATGLETLGVATQSSPKPAFLSVLSDKDAGGIWNELKGRISEVICFQIASERSWTQATQEIPGPMMPSFAEAFQEASTRSSWVQGVNQPWIICGSVAAVGEVFAFFETHGWNLSAHS